MLKSPGTINKVHIPGTLQMKDPATELWEVGSVAIEEGCLGMGLQYHC